MSLQDHAERYPEAAQVLAWLGVEQDYADRKFGDQKADHDAWMAEGGIGEDSEWWRQVTQYVSRARLFGLETPQGRQALAKFMATTLGLVECAVRNHGDLPEPGWTSGEVRPWADAPPVPR